MKKTKIICLVMLGIIAVQSMLGKVEATDIIRGVSSERKSNNEVNSEWNFTVSGKDSFDATDRIDNLKLAMVTDEKRLINGKIAPGTSGSFSITVDTNASILGAAYQIKFENFSDTFPKNLKFKVDNQDYNLETGFIGIVDAKANAEPVTHTVNWEWAYENEEDEETDYYDTVDGMESKDITFDIVIEASQLIVLPKTGE